MEENEQMIREKDTKEEIKAAVDDILQKVTESSKPLAEKLKATPKKKLITILAIAVVAIVSIIVSISLLSNNYSTPLKLMEKQENANKYSVDNMIEQNNGIIAKELREAVDLLKNSDEYQDMIESLEDAWQETKENNIDRYGKDYKVRYVVTDKEKMDSSELRSIRKHFKTTAEYLTTTYEDARDLDSEDWEDLADELGISKSDIKKLHKILKKIADKLEDLEITEGYSLEVTKQITGSELDGEPKESDMTIEVIKVNGRWTSASIILSVFDLLDL